MADAEQRLALIEVVERDGRSHRQHAVTHWPLTIGRGFDCDVSIDDPHVAAEHARIAADEAGRLWLEVGETRNGLRIGRRMLHAGERVALDAARGDAWQLGHTRLRVRLPGDAIAPERALAVASGGGWTFAFGIALWALLLGQHWIESDPDAGLGDWLPVIVAPPVALMLWCALWAAASKLFQHRFEFGAHWSLATRWLLGVLAGGTLARLAAAALGWPALFRVVGVGEAAALTLWLLLHARLVLPTHARALAVSFGAAFVVGLGVLMALNRQREQPLVGPLYMYMLPHPQWRVARPLPPERFVEQARTLRATLDARARAEPDEADTPPHDDID